MKNPIKLGRPTAITETSVRKLEEAFAMGFNTKEACQIADISRSTLYKYFSENQTFRTRLEKLKPDQPFQVYIPVESRFIINRWFESMEKNESPTGLEANLAFKILQQYYGREKVYG
jgi:hypothetical protein